MKYPTKASRVKTPLQVIQHMDNGMNMVEACRSLEAEFPELAARLQVQLPDECSRRVGQSIAAASLPEVYKVTEQEA
jgi:hypothetical protein